jgi:hypothetical protein
VSASKLQAMATFLKVPVSYFFEGGPIDPIIGKKNGGPTPDFGFAGLLSTSDGVALCTAFQKIESKAVRRVVVTMAETLASEQ